MKHLMLVAICLTLAACATIEGAGRDMQNAGAAVSDEARRAQVGG
ncbi:entericidin A/B family lipoprotein [Ketogulonicigenium vulgare]|uniref:Entericidin EcnAB n=1 Tax=Ketogulonicigenium vulgare (strain WSH-001) TaxID=759362 RepID=F9Y544_KETVW|nr:entericidin A/B family lipoprotein [Ketogulonicigenium vulgare]ADO42477.1 hypothetical protein EIO_1341 [Ketogulonicigenium vulgare Y25]AEM40676.1 hypothetical protein KVU_0837 [Ketogulonicigenium vulgare WSH-001]ALJ80847.1 hypothetical protein KVH_06445 [Ketogulonicigenium vulgare]ANW35001.1 entericidin, EcnA/B family [Ketogulonicigenium vulgare]AOZ54390.1 hypothetical protein KVC_1375 [Ketogulonicigenium vulgare]